MSFKKIADTSFKVYAQRQTSKLSLPTLFACNKNVELL